MFTKWNLKKNNNYITWEDNLNILKCFKKVLETIMEEF